MTGHIAPPPPPSPDAPPAPPLPPPNPLPPFAYAYNGASDACSGAGVYQGEECHDGGKLAHAHTMQLVSNLTLTTCFDSLLIRRGFHIPPVSTAFESMAMSPILLIQTTYSILFYKIRYCDYGSQNSYCGPRPFVAQYSVIGDDSCEHNSDGVCQDGGARHGCSNSHFEHQTQL